MNLLIFNNDGSVKYECFPEMIMRGDDNVYHVYVAIDGYSNEEYTAVALCTLPDGNETTPLVGLPTSITQDGTSYSGYRFTLTQAETAYVGNIKISIRLTSLTPEKKFTYGKILTVNKSTVEPTVARITIAQYENLTDSLSSFQAKYTARSFRCYPNLAALQADEENLAIGQFSLVADGFSVYEKTNDGLALRGSFVLS